MLLSHIWGYQTGPGSSSSCVLHICCYCALKGKVLPISIRGQSPSPTWGINTQVWSHFWDYLRPVPPPAKEMGKDHQLYSNPIFSLPNSLKHTSCFLTISDLLTQGVPPLSLLPAAHSQWQFMIDPFVSQEDRLEERIYFLCYFPLISLRTKATHIKAARGKPWETPLCSSSNPAFQDIPWWYKGIYTKDLIMKFCSSLEHEERKKDKIWADLKHPSCSYQLV